MTHYYLRSQIESAVAMGPVDTPEQGILCSLLALMNQFGIYAIKAGRCTVLERRSLKERGVRPHAITPLSMYQYSVVKEAVERLRSLADFEEPAEGVVYNDKLLAKMALLALEEWKQK